MFFYSLLFSLFLAMGNINIYVIVVPGWDTVSPPDLSGDTPITDIFHPVKIDFRPTFWIEFNFFVFGGFECKFGHGRHFYKPLFGKMRLDHGIAAVTMTNGMRMWLNFD